MPSATWPGCSPWVSPTDGDLGLAQTQDLLGWAKKHVLPRLVWLGWGIIRYTKRSQVCSSVRHMPWLWVQSPAGALMRGQVPGQKPPCGTASDILMEIRLRLTFCFLSFRAALWAEEPGRE